MSDYKTTLRDEFAGYALRMFYSGIELRTFDRNNEYYKEEEAEKYARQFARASYMIADAMLEEREEDVDADTEPF